jgi:hypothetical protein
VVGLLVVDVHEELGPIILSWDKQKAYNGSSGIVSCKRAWRVGSFNVADTSGIGAVVQVEKRTQRAGRYR